MRALKIVGAILAFLVLAQCGDPPKEKMTESIGTGTVTNHDKDRVGFNREQCRFSVKLEGHYLSYSAIRATGGVPFQKCLNMKNRTPIMVTKVTRLINPDKGKVTYVGRIDAVDFQLN